MTSPAAPIEPRIPFVYSGKVRQALQLAERVHRGQVRASGDHPYFLHLVAVASVLIAAGADDELIMAAFLHDAVEDTATTITEVEDRFGARVARLVEAVTKRPTPGMRKDEINRLVEEKMAVADIDEAALKGADLLANISDLILDQRQQGYAHWEKVFKNRRRANLKVGHYITLASIITERLGSQNAFPVLVSHLQTRAGELQRLYEDWDS